MTVLLKKKDNKTGLKPMFSDLFDLDRFWDNDLMPSSLFGSVALTIPSVNIKEGKNEFVIEMGAPGFERNDFEVEVENGNVIISCDKEIEVKDEDENYTRREYNYNSFKRSFMLPDTVDADKIKASYKNGILNVELPKKEDAKMKPRKTVKVS